MVTGEAIEVLIIDGCESRGLVNFGPYPLVEQKDWPGPWITRQACEARWSDRRSLRKGVRTDSKGSSWRSPWWSGIWLFDFWHPRRLPGGAQDLRSLPAGPPVGGGAV